MAERLLPANTTLLQPGSSSFRLSDALTAQAAATNRVQMQAGSLNNVITTIQGQISTIQGQISTLQGQVTTIQGDITTIQGQITTLQNDITTINNRLTAAGIP